MSKKPRMFSREFSIHPLENVTGIKRLYHTMKKKPIAVAVISTNYVHQLRYGLPPNVLPICRVHFGLLDTMLIFVVLQEEGKLLIIHG